MSENTESENILVSLRENTNIIQDPLMTEIRALLKDFDEDCAKSAYMIDIMSETRLAYIEQRARWARDERYFDDKNNEPEEPIEFESQADLRTETLCIVPDDLVMVQKIMYLIKKYEPRLSERIVIKHVNKDYISK